MLYNTYNILLLLLIFGATFIKYCELVCEKKFYKNGHVCLCNTTHCDHIPNLLHQIPSGNYEIYTTSKMNLGFHKTIGKFENILTTNEKIHLEIEEPYIKYQTIVGFGGHFTDAFGYNLFELPEQLQNQILTSIFDNKNMGIGYSLCKVPIGPTEFSLKPYTHANLTNNITNSLDFHLQPEDIFYKIPYISKALNMNPSLLNLVTSVRSAPPWMKTNNNWCGTSELKLEFYQLWSEYILKFFDEYRKFNITFWGTIAYDHPINGYFPCSWVPQISMGWLAYNSANWIGNYFGPIIRRSKYNHLKIMCNDEARISIYSVYALLKDENILKYLDGITVHSYLSNVIPASEYKYAKSNKKDTFILESELHLYGPVTLGEWQNAKIYIENIYEILENGVIGFMDGNMVANLNGGPSYINASSDAIIIVNKTSQEFYKQPTYYVMGHFSKFIIPNSQRIHVKIYEQLDNIKVLAFKRPDKRIATILYNGDGENAKKICLKISNRILKITIQPNSINTLIWYDEYTEKILVEDETSYLLTIFVAFFIIVVLVVLKSE